VRLERLEHKTLQAILGRLDYKEFKVYKVRLERLDYKDCKVFKARLEQKRILEQLITRYSGRDWNKWGDYND
jgi:hypothetical protein